MDGAGQQGAEPLSLSVLSVLPVFSVLYMFSTIALPNSLVFRSVAPVIRRSKS